MEQPELDLQIDIDNMSPEELESFKLQNNWTFGYFKPGEWTPTPVSPKPINTIPEFWRWVNATIGHDYYQLISNAQETWWFKDDNLPNWDKYGDYKGLVELIIDSQDGDKDNMFKILLSVIGEVLPNAEDIVGIRIKPYETYATIRIWIAVHKDVKSEKMIGTKVSEIEAAIRILVGSDLKITKEDLLRKAKKAAVPTQTRDPPRVTQQKKALPRTTKKNW